MIINESLTLNLPDKRYLALSGTIQYPVESGIRYLVEFDIWNPVKKYPVHPYK